MIKTVIRETINSYQSVIDYIYAVRSMPARNYRWPFIGCTTKLDLRHINNDGDDSFYNIKYFYPENTYNFIFCCVI